MDKISKNASVLEAMLFSGGEPCEITRLALSAEISETEILSASDELNDLYLQSGSALCVLRLDDKLQLVTKQEYADVIRVLLDKKRNTPLSNAAMEVLAVIAYNQPVTKNFVEQVRGVDCAGVISTLCAKGLIEEKGRLELPGKPLVYGTTDNFLRCFSLSDISELPEIPINSETNSLKAINKDPTVLDGQASML